MGNFANVAMKKYLHMVVMEKCVESRDNLKGIGVCVLIKL